MKKVVEFYSSVISEDNVQDPKKYYKIFVEDMILILDKKSDVVNICIEIFLLISYLTGQDEVFKSVLESSKDFMHIMQKIINNYSVRILSNE